MKTKYLIPAVLIVAFLFSSCTQSDANSLANDAMEVNIDELAAIPAFTTDTNSLSQSEMDGLLLMREEEKMAQDVYDSFYSTYGVINFDRISNSETRHTAAVLALINHFGLIDPVLTLPGKFSSTAIQGLYNQLIAMGTSSNKALSTGGFIEEYDIADLKKLIAETTNTDIIAVYGNLLKGSENHLRAFVRTLKIRGIVYVPQILTSTDFNAIIAATNSNGFSKGRGGNCRN
ncbi:MAG: DUF2202 domain-containing protein [Paludibacter sp.]